MTVTAPARPLPMTSPQRDTQQQLESLIETVASLGVHVSQLAQAVTVNADRMAGIEAAMESLTINFVRPALMQANENREAIAALTTNQDRLYEAMQRHQDWLDEDRRDLLELQRETSQQIQGLLDTARAERIANQERFDAMLAEVISLSKRVNTLEDAA